jgi:hypothetical protein
MELIDPDIIITSSALTGFTGLTGNDQASNMGNIPFNNITISSNTQSNNIDESIYKSNSNISLQESILNDSRITPTGNGSPNSKPYCSRICDATQPTSGQKWWAAVLLGFLFALISSPAAYYITSKVSTSLGGAPLIDGTGPTFIGLLIHTIIFIIIIRIILW